MKQDNWTYSFTLFHCIALPLENVFPRPSLHGSCRLLCRRLVHRCSWTRCTTLHAGLDLNFTLIGLRLGILGH